MEDRRSDGVIEKLLKPINFTLAILFCSFAVAYILDIFF